MPGMGSVFKIVVFADALNASTEKPAKRAMNMISTGALILKNGRAPNNRSSDTTAMIPEVRAMLESENTKSTS